MPVTVAIAAAPRRADPCLLEHLRKVMDGCGHRTASSQGETWGPKPASHESLLDLSLRRGALHEWVPEEGLRDPGTKGLRENARRTSPWIPPLSVVTELAHRALALGASVPPFLSPFLLWIGRQCWPYGRALVRGRHAEDRTLLEQSIFVDAPDIGARLWAIDLALRCPAVGVVVADGRGLDMAATRRLALAAEAGGGLALLLRPAWEARQLSAAATRWRVRPARSAAATQRWDIQLLRCKGLRAGAPAAGACVCVEADGATGAMRVLAEVGQRSGEAAAAPARRVG